MFFNLISFLTAVTLTFHIQLIDKHKEVGIDTCTAVWISQNEALTAAHCVENTTGKMWVNNSDNQSFSASIIKTDKKLDLCLLHINCPKHTFASLGNPVNKGDKIFVMSSEEDMPATYGEGIVENVLDDPYTKSLSIIHSAIILHGASGSGLFNRWGQLVGINQAIFPGLAIAIDETALVSFLARR